MALRRLGLSLLLLLPAARPAWAADHAALARRLVEATGVRTGVCVHLGCGDGKLTVELARGGNLLVHGLSTDSAEVAQVRKFIQSKGLYGQASVDLMRLPRLPYAENLIDIVVVEDWARLSKAGLTIKEVIRVLCPEGIAYLRDPAGKISASEFTAELTKVGVKGFELLRPHENWIRIRKLRPKTMDDWSHVHHAADGNPVSRDRMGVPIAPRWIEQIGRIRGWCSAGGRMFYLYCEPLHPRLGAKLGLSVSAHNAYNGRPLWKLGLGHVSTRNYYRFSHSVYADWRTFIAGEKRVYTLITGKVTALGAATGKTERVYDSFKLNPRGRGFTLQHYDGILFMISESSRSIRAVDSETGKLLWQSDMEGKAPFRRGNQEGREWTVLIGDGRAYFLDDIGKVLRCVEAKTGKPVWRTDVSAWPIEKLELLFVRDGTLACYEGPGKWSIHALSAQNGKQLWTYRGQSNRGGHHNKPIFPHTFLADGLVWVKESDSPPGTPSHRNKLRMLGCDPKSGEVKRTLRNLSPRYSSFHCFPHTATDRFYITSIPSDFLDLKTGQVHKFRAAFSICQVGLIPANGLLYAPGRNSTYGSGGEVQGYVAYAPQESGAPEFWKPDEKRRLERGPAYDEAANAGSGNRRSEWPTYRHDPRRSGGTAGTVPADLKPLWSSKLAEPAPGGRDAITAPVIAQGLAFVGLIDSHCVVALDVKTGRERWRFTAGGRIDVPPTIHQGLCLFGSADGWACCLRAADGKLVWRFLGAAMDRRIPVRGQLESEWPVTGGVLVENGAAHFAAGRSTALAPGLTVYALDPRNGDLKWWSRPKPHPRKPHSGLQGDLLVASGGILSISGSIEGQFDLRTGRPINDRGPSRMLMSYPFGRIGKKFGYYANMRLLDHHTQYFGGVYAQRVVWDPTNDTRVFASRYFAFPRNYFPKMHKEADGLFSMEPDFKLKIAVDPGWRYLDSQKVTAKDPPLWAVSPPDGRRFTALALAGDVLFAAGALDHFEQKKGVVWAVSTGDGKKQQVIQLDDAPAAEGLAVAYGRLYVSTRHGKLLCFGKE